MHVLITRAIVPYGIESESLAIILASISIPIKLKSESLSSVIIIEMRKQTFS